MITPHPRLQINVAEQLARSIVAAAHAPSPNLVGDNESWSPVGGERLFQQPARPEMHLISLPSQQVVEIAANATALRAHQVIKFQLIPLSFSLWRTHLRRWWAHRMFPFRALRPPSMRAFSAAPRACKSPLL